MDDPTKFWVGLILFPGLACFITFLAIMLEKAFEDSQDMRRFPGGSVGFVLLLVAVATALLYIAFSAK